MKPTAIILSSCFLLGLLQVESIAGLVCYTCEFNAVLPQLPSSKTCEQAPLDTEVFDFNFPDVTPPGGGDPIKVLTYCITTTGYIGNKLVVLRTGVPSTTVVENGCIPAKLPIPIPGLQKVQTCYCNTDKCNVHVAEEPTTTTGSPKPTTTTESGAAAMAPLLVTSVILGLVIHTFPRLTY